MQQCWLSSLRDSLHLLKRCTDFKTQLKKKKKELEISSANTCLSFPPPICVVQLTSTFPVLQRLLLSLIPGNTLARKLTRGLLTSLTQQVTNTPTQPGHILQVRRAHVPWVHGARGDAPRHTLTALPSSSKSWQGPRQEVTYATLCSRPGSSLQSSADEGC